MIRHLHQSRRQEIVETVTDPNRPEKKPILHYYITNVWEWADGSHIVTKTHRYRVQNNNND